MVPGRVLEPIPLGMTVLNEETTMVLPSTEEPSFLALGNGGPLDSQRGQLPLKTQQKAASCQQEAIPYLSELAGAAFFLTVCPTCKAQLLREPGNCPQLARPAKKAAFGSPLLAASNISLQCKAPQDDVSSELSQGHFRKNRCAMPRGEWGHTLLKSHRAGGSEFSI